MIIGFPHSPGHGGPGSFQLKFEKILIENGHTITYCKDNKKPDLVFVIGGTKRLIWLILMRFNGVPVVHRLDGLSWLHKKQSFKHYLYGEFGNLNFKFIHRFLASYVIYQSYFVKNWWSKLVFGNASRNEIIYNGVDLEVFTPGNDNISLATLKLVCLEGHLDYTPYAIDLINFLADHLAIPVEVYGKIRFDPDGKSLSKKVIFNGFVKNEDLPAVYRNSIYLSLDVNAACPNTVIEALACGAPVVGFDTGALKELVTNESGIVVDYGGNPWKLDKPDFKALLDAINTVISGYSFYSENARQLAISRYDIKQMFAAYELVINKLITQKHH